MRKLLLILALNLVAIIASPILLSQVRDVDSTRYETLYKDINSEYSVIPLTEISLRTPKHFEEFTSESFGGFMNKGTAASIVGFEYPKSPYVIQNDTLTQDSFTSQGVTLVNVESSKTYEGLACKFYFVKFQVDNVDIIRVMFFTGTYYKTVHLQANYPLAFDNLLRKVIMESFRTVKFD
ncbi:MAG: hypothetical protein PF448_08120 [Bacteroidales bacterium]|jgi:hypothetical protein|nr:hypothetical protein [Bacteroidales bacterium]